METQSSPRNEATTIFVAATTAIIAMSGLVAAIVINHRGNPVKQANETALASKVQHTAEQETETQATSPSGTSYSNTTNASFRKSQPLNAETNSDDAVQRPTAQLAKKRAPISMTPTELHNTLRDLFRVNHQPRPSTYAALNETENPTDQVLAILNDPTLKSQSAIWKFLFEQSESDHSTVPSVEASRRLATFLPRAFRRPVDELEVDQYTQVFDNEFQSTLSFEKAMMASVRSALTSPEFTQLNWADPADASHQQYATAATLSYLLWETMPDDQLMMAAREGRLSAQKAIRGQVRRMLKDDRSKRFTNRFGMKWLGQDSLSNDQASLLQETFCGNRSILGFVEATEESDSLKTLAKTDRLTAKWVLDVLLYRQPSTLDNEEADRKLLNDWMGVGVDDVEQVRQMVLGNREVYTDSFVRHLLSHTDRLTLAAATPEEIKEISNTVMFNKYRSHNLMEEVIVYATLGGKEISSTSRFLTAEERIRR